MLTTLLALSAPFQSGSSSGVERKLPKLDVAGSIPVSRSILPASTLYRFHALSPRLNHTMSTSDLAIQFWEGKSYGRALKLEPAWIALTRVIEQNQGSYLKRAMAEVERIQTVQRVCPGSDLGMKIAMSTQHPR